MPRLHRLLPDRGEVELADQMGGLELAELAHPDRPYTISNFALTLDGQTTIGASSRSIGSATDTAMLVALRTRVDALLVGAATMRAERYGRPLPDAAKRGRRERQGLPQEPLTVIVSGRLELPWDAPLFTTPGARVLLVTAADSAPPQCAAAVRVLRQPGGIDLAALMAHLRAERGVRSLLCEGGPTVHAQLVGLGLLDELFVTHAPVIAGGSGPGLLTGLLEGERPLALEWLLTDPQTNELFGRYRPERRTTNDERPA